MPFNFLSFIILLAGSYELYSLEFPAKGESISDFSKTQPYREFNIERKLIFKAGPMSFDKVKDFVVANCGKEFWKDGKREFSRNTLISVYKQYLTDSVTRKSDLELTPVFLVDSGAGVVVATRIPMDGYASDVKFLEPLEIVSISEQVRKTTKLKTINIDLSLAIIGGLDLRNQSRSCYLPSTTMIIHEIEDLKIDRLCHGFFSDGYRDTQWDYLPIGLVHSRSNGSKFFPMLGQKRPMPQFVDGYIHPLSGLQFQKILISDSSSIEIGQYSDWSVNWDSFKNGRNIKAENQLSTTRLSTYLFPTSCVRFSLFEVVEESLDEKRIHNLLAINSALRGIPYLSGREASEKIRSSGFINYLTRIVDPISNAVTAPDNEKYSGRTGVDTSGIGWSSWTGSAYLASQMNQDVSAINLYIDAEARNQSGRQAPMPLSLMNDSVIDKGYAIFYATSQYLDPSIGMISEQKRDITCPRGIAISDIYDSSAQKNGYRGRIVPNTEDVLVQRHFILRTSPVDDFIEYAVACGASQKTKFREILPSGDLGDFSLPLSEIWEVVRLKISDGSLIFRSPLPGVLMPLKANQSGDMILCRDEFGHSVRSAKNGAIISMLPRWLDKDNLLEGAFFSGDLSLQEYERDYRCFIFDRGGNFSLIHSKGLGDEVWQYTFSGK